MKFVFLMSCKDRSGIIAKVSTAISETEGNIVSFREFKSEDNQYFMRSVIECEDKTILGNRLRGVSCELGGWCSFSDESNRKKFSIVCSGTIHCLQAIIAAIDDGDITAELCYVLTNKSDRFMPEIEKRCLKNRLRISSYDVPRMEFAIKEMSRQMDFIVLARYMNIVTKETLKGWKNRMINIHHSFLPAFAGGEPYRRAWERGVKLIGATAHYVTEELDAGPIIAQDVARVSHEATPDDMKRLGRGLESRTLVAAIKAHAENRVIVHNGRTVVFEP